MCVCVYIYIYIYSQWINEKMQGIYSSNSFVLLSTWYQSLGFEFARKKRQILLKEFRRNLGFGRCAFETQCLGERDMTLLP